MNLGELELRAEELYGAAGFDLGAPAPCVALARRLLGDDAIRAVHAAALPGNAALVRVGEDWRIYVRGCAAPAAKRLAVMHELGHWGAGNGSSEEEADALASLLLVPRRAFIAALGRHGASLPKLAREFAVSETCVALRLGEVTDEPVAVVAPMSVRTRGQQWSWPSENQLRKWAIRARPGLRKTRLRDDPRRVLLRIA